MRIRDVEITMLQRFYKRTTYFRGKEINYSSSIEYLKSDITHNV